MKYYISSSLLFMIALLAGCTSEISDGCPLFDNVILNFRYPDETGKDIFADHIDQVDVLIFDHNGYYYDWQTVPKDSLRKFQGKVLAVEPGEYLIVCWGNVLDNTLTAGSSTMQNYCIVNSGSYEGNAIHYAPRKSYTTRSASEDYSIYTVSAPAKGIHETTYDFMAAYWRINVYVSGYEDQGGGAALPDVHVTDMPQGYDFLLSPLETHIDYRTGTENVTTTEGEWAYAGFHTAFFSPGDDDINIHIRNKADGLSVGMVNLDSFLAENGRTLSYEKVEVIDVLINFTEFGVSVTVPDWETVSIIPDL